MHDILPWIQTGGKEIAVYCRDPRRAADLLQKFPGIALGSLADFAADPRPLRRALVLAAPLSAAAAARLAAGFASGDLLLDFRADSHADRFAFAGEVVTLSDVFTELRGSADILSARGTEAAAAIALLARRQLDRVHYRPFGWEDVCA